MISENIVEHKVLHVSEQLYEVHHTCLANFGDSSNNKFPNVSTCNVNIPVHHEVVRFGIYWRAIHRYCVIGPGQMEYLGLISKCASGNFVISY